MRPMTKTPTPDAVPAACLCLHGFGPYLVPTSPPFFDGAKWITVPAYELRVCPAHAGNLPACGSGELDGAAARLDQALCALADVVDVLWNDGDWSPDTIDAIAARLAFLKPRGAL